MALRLPGVVTTRHIPGAEKIGALDLNQAENLQVILPYAFYWRKNITGVIESMNVKEIGEHTFCDCTGLTNLYLPKVTTVEESAFDGCT